MAEILQSLPEDVLRPALTYPAFRPVLEKAAQAQADIRSALERFS
jgi:hypothetical protein